MSVYHLPIILAMVLTCNGGAKVSAISGGKVGNNSSMSVTRQVDGATERIQFRKNETVMRTRYVPVWNRTANRTRPHVHVKAGPKRNDSRPIERSDTEKPSKEETCRDSSERDNTEAAQHHTYMIRNGKMYRVVKTLRHKSCGEKNASNGQSLQRRTFNTVDLNSLMPKFSGIFPIKWTSDSGQNVTQKASGFNQWDFLSKLKPAENLGTRVISNYHGEKIKKLLNLFTIVKFDNGGCDASGLRGTCYHQTECHTKGGRPIGVCAKGFGVCCYIEKTCGQQTRENCTYFVNEGYPQPSTSAPKICALTVNKAHPGVQQLRLEFQKFELRGPDNGSCLNDRFQVNGHNTNDIIPDICGINTGQHVYVDVDESNGPVKLNVILMGTELPRTFRIKVTQLRRNDEYLAPKNCLQYYTKPTGIIQTFNYQLGNNANPPEAVPGYFNNLNYAICIRKEKGFCSISYENENREGIDPTFQLTNVDQDGERLVPPMQSGAEIFNCPDDYIILNGIRLCGERLNDASLDLDYTRNHPVIDLHNGPFILSFRTNEAVTGRGFYLKYKENPCMG